MKKFFENGVAYVVFAIILFVGTMLIIRNSNKKLQNEINDAKAKLVEYEAKLAPLKSTNFDSLYRVTPYKNWKKIDSLVCGSYVNEGLERFTTLGSIKDSIDKLNLSYYDYPNYNRIEKDIDSLYNTTLNIRTTIIKKKYPKQYKKELNAAYEADKFIKQIKASAERERREEQLRKEFRRNYKETYTVTQTPFGTVTSVSYTRR